MTPLEPRSDMRCPDHASTHGVAQSALAGWVGLWSLNTFRYRTTVDRAKNRPICRGVCLHSTRQQFGLICRVNSAHWQVLQGVIRVAPHTTLPSQPSPFTLSPFLTHLSFDLWTMTINYSRNHAARVRPTYPVVVALS